MRLKYTGKHNEVQVEGGGRPIGLVQRGGTIEVPDDLGKALLKQNPESWTKPAGKKPKEE